MSYKEVLEKQFLISHENLEEIDKSGRNNTLNCHLPVIYFHLSTHGQLSTKRHVFWVDHNTPFFQDIKSLE